MRDFACLSCLAACCLALPASAQPSPSTEPDPLQLPAAQQVLREELELRRLTLSDAWMKHLDREERSQLRLQRWVGGAFFGLAAVGWSVGVVANETAHEPRSRSLMLGGAAALSAGLLAAQLLLSDDYEARRVATWGWSLELAALGSAMLVLGRDDDSCHGDCPLLLDLAGASAIGLAVVSTLVELLSPPVYVSRHYTRYLSKAPGERTAYALDLMLAQESRRRTANYLYFSSATMQTTLFGIGAAYAEQDATRAALAVLAATTIVSAGVNLIVQLVERTPSEKLALGLPPPPEL
ncbi:MAG TPA: hypothetical protein VJR89_28665 [Polyangiales bacterium]|nr:hypothetical protein [Polyangiales bacterium]